MWWRLSRRAGRSEGEGQVLRAEAIGPHRTMRRGGDGGGWLHTRCARYTGLRCEVHGAEIIFWGGVPTRSEISPCYACMGPALQNMQHLPAECGQINGTLISNSRDILP